MLLKNKVLFVATVLLSLSACKDEKNKNQASQVPTVEAIKTYNQDIPLSFEYSARAQGSKETEVRARVGGILLKRNYVEGSSVSVGDLLFQIDPKPYEVALLQAKAKLSQETAQLKAAETQWERISKLFEQRIVSEKSRDEARANLDGLKATTALAEAEVQAAQLNLDYTTVTAPISGITSMETQSEGSLIGTSASNSLLTNITQLDPIYVIFSAADSDMFKLGSMIENGMITSPRDNSEQEVIAKIKFNDDSFYAENGKINFINPTIDEKTGTIKLRAVFPNPDKKIMPGQFLRIVIAGLTRKNAIVVPQEAIMQGAQGSFVYKINAQGIVESAVVEIGFTTPDGQWIIDKGLNEGDIVVVSGTMKVRQGSPAKAVIKNEVTNDNLESK